MSGAKKSTEVKNMKEVDIENTEMFPDIGKNTLVSSVLFTSSTPVSSVRLLPLLRPFRVYFSGAAVAPAKKKLGKKK